MVVDSISPATAGVRNRRKIRAVLLLAVLVIAAIVVAVLSPVCVWSGHFELLLNVVSSSGKRINDVSYATFSKHEEAERAESGTSEVSASCFHTAVKDHGRFIANVACSGRSQLGIETSYFEYRYIVVRVKYEDGKESRQVEEITPGRGDRSIAIAVP